MSKRTSPKQNARVRTLKRWANPTNRPAIGYGGHNPNCTRNRNVERFDKRKSLIKQMGIADHEE